MGRHLVLFTALVCAALIVGGQYVVWFDYAPGTMSASFYTEKMQHAIRVIGLPLFALQGLTALTTIISTKLWRRETKAFLALAAASVCCVTGVLLTFFGNIPLLNLIATWNIAAPPADWKHVADTWWWFHSVRIGVQIIALALILRVAFKTRTTAS